MAGTPLSCWSFIKGEESETAVCGGPKSPMQPGLGRKRLVRSFLRSDQGEETAADLFYPAMRFNLFLFLVFIEKYLTL